MTKCAVCNISNNVVTNVIVADPGDQPYTGTYFVKITADTNIGGIGYTYDREKNKFIAPKPFDSWHLDTDTCLWVAPISQPADVNNYYWDESNLTWVAYSG